MTDDREPKGGEGADEATGSDVPAEERYGEAVPVVLTTHETEEARMRRALARVAALGTVLEPPRTIRIEDL